MYLRPARNRRSVSGVGTRRNSCVAFRKRRIKKKRKRPRIAWIIETIVRPDCNARKKNVNVKVHMSWLVLCFVSFFSLYRSRGSTLLARAYDNLFQNNPLTNVLWKTRRFQPSISLYIGGYVSHLLIYTRCSQKKCCWNRDVHFWTSEVRAWVSFERRLTATRTRRLELWISNASETELSLADIYIRV